MRVRWALLVVVVALAVNGGSAAYGASSGTTSTTSITNVTYNRSCEVNSGNDSQVQLSECVYGEFKQVNAQLQAELAKQKALYGSAAINKVQDAWLKYRSATCSIFPGAKGGTAHGMYVSGCELQVTIDRLIDARESLTFNPTGGGPG